MTGSPPPPPLLQVWRSFDAFPMETLSKAWVLAHRGARQRTVAELEADRARTGASGNCFDLAVWLRHRLADAGVESWYVSDDIQSPDAHVAVVARSEGRRWLCDLGDQWLEPLPVDEPIATPRPGLFPAAAVTLRVDGEEAEVAYHRPGGKASTQRYHLRPVEDPVFAAAAAANQAYLAQVLVEVREPAAGAHWEYEAGAVRRSTPHGLVEERSPRSVEEAAQLLQAQAGFDPAWTEECLRVLAAHGLSVLDGER